MDNRAELIDELQEMQDRLSEINASASDSLGEGERRGVRHIESDMRQVLSKMKEGKDGFA